MKIKIISVGKIKENFYVKNIESMIKEIRKHALVEVIEVSDEKCPEKLSDKEMIQVKDKEGDRILSKITSDDYVIALAIEGKMIDSSKFKNQMNKNEVAFIIGGSLGLSDKVLKRANYKLSFSRMTFPHQLMKVILIEQIERAVKP
jgi:23S rRNA (pseudouridine1915-N3)-methyltransferase